MIACARVLEFSINKIKLLSILLNGISTLWRRLSFSSSFIFFFFYFLFSFFDFKSVLTYYTLVSWHIHRRKYPNQWGKNRMNIDRLCDFLYGETCVAMNTILSFFFFYFSDSQFNRSDRIAIRDEWSQQKGDEEKKIEENRKEDDNNKEWWRRRQQQQPKKKFTLKR